MFPFFPSTQKTSKIPYAFYNKPILIVFKGVVKNRLSFFLNQNDFIFIFFQLLIMNFQNKSTIDLLLATTMKLNHNFYRIHILPSRLKISGRLILILNPSRLCLFCLISLFAVEFSCRLKRFRSHWRGGGALIRPRETVLDTF